MFEISMARLARLSLTNVRLLLNDQGELGFKALYKATALPDILFDATSVVFHVMQMLDAEQQKAANSLQRQFNPVDIINRMKVVVGNRRISHLDFLTTMMEHNIRWIKP